MSLTGTFSAPMLQSDVPTGKAVLRSRIAYRVKDGDTPNTYDLYSCTCADGSSMREGFDFDHSYSPVGSIDLLPLLLLPTSNFLYWTSPTPFRIVSSLIHPNVSTSLYLHFIWNGLLRNGPTLPFHQKFQKISSFNVSSQFKEQRMLASVGISSSLVAFLN